MVLSPIDANDQILEAELDGEAFYVGLSWNEEAQIWTVSLRNLSGEMLSSGLPVIADWPMLHQVRHPSHPPGEIAVSITREGAILDRGAFMRGDALLVYVEAAELV